jgi:putative flippase GtrA
LKTLEQLFRRFASHVPPGEIGRYLLVGIWNTAFAYGTFALFTALLAPHMPMSYVAGGLLSSLLNITVSFLGYKWFVFKTKGNYLREWARCLMVYSGSIILGLALLPPLVLAVKYATGNPGAAPYIAGALVTGAQVILSFLGHRKFSFRERQRQSAADAVGTHGKVPPQGQKP